MVEDKVNIAIRQLTMAAALMQEARRVLKEEGVQLIDSHDCYRFKEPVFQILCKGEFADAGVKEIAETIGEEVRRDENYVSVKTNGIVIFELAEEKKEYENG